LNYPTVKSIKWSAVVLLALSFGCSAKSLSYDGSVEIEQRLFLDPSENDGIQLGQSSVVLEMELYGEWNNGNDRLVFEPFLRQDAEDNERSHADIRQLVWTHYGEKSEFSLGLGRVFWGVTESQHLVDIINQTDGVENIDGEDKLGQPMAHYSYFSDFGTFEGFVLPYFRERTFEGINGRLRGGLLVDNDEAVYESSSEQSHVDLALRYSHTIGDWSLGFSWFAGTSREPDLFRFADFQAGTSTPHYPQIEQLGSDIQFTRSGWLLKLEAIRRNFDDASYTDFSAATLGAEYTLVGILNTSYDLGLLGEYSWDERDELATTIFQNDAFLGARLVLNDLSDSQILLGFSNDLDNTDSQAIFLEGATRIANAVTLNVELRYFDSDTPSDPLFRFKDDSLGPCSLDP